MSQLIKNELKLTLKFYKAEACLFFFFFFFGGSMLLYQRLPKRFEDFKVLDIDLI